MDELLLFTIDEPFTALQTDGLLLTILIKELSPQHRWMSSYYLRLTSPSLHFRLTGSLLQFTLTSPSLHFKQTGSLLLFALTSPLLHISRTGSFLQFLMTSSPLNSDGRAPTIHSDEPFTALQNRRASSYNSY